MVYMLSSLYPTRLEGFKFPFQSHRHQNTCIAEDFTTVPTGPSVKCNVTHTVPLKLSAVYLLQDHLLVQRGNLWAIC